MQASKTLGHLARSSVVPNADYVEFEVDRGLEWLHSDQSSRRLAACFVLKELAENAPTLFFAKTGDFLERVWIVLRDGKPIIRLSAARALSACLRILAQRSAISHVNWYCKIYEQVQEGLAHRNNAAAMHGSLLVIGEMLSHTGDFMVPRFQEVCQAVMAVREHKDRCIRVSVIEILPRLAQFCSDMFARVYLEECLVHLMHAAKSSELRPQAFLALGQLALAVGNNLQLQLPQVLALVREYMNNKNKRVYCREALDCVASLVIAVSEDMSPHVEELVDSMFAGGINETLITTLTVISERLPVHQQLIQHRLLQELSALLDGQLYLSPGTTLPIKHIASSSGTAVGASSLSNVPPSSSLLASGAASGGGGATGANGGESNGGSNSTGGGGGAATANGNGGALVPKPETKRMSTTSRLLSKLSLLTTGGGDGSSSTPQSAAAAGALRYTHPFTGEAAGVVVLSLRTLGSFPMEDDVHLLPFVRDCVARYLDNPNVAVRKEAALTCCRLLVEPGKPLRYRGPSANVIEEVLKRLLQVTVADPDPTIRQTLIQALDGRFDPFLCQAHHIRTLFLLMQDEALSIRLDAIKLLGRLAGLNPAYVLPPMRLTLLRLLTELQFGREDNTAIQGKEEATHLLCDFLRAKPLQRLVKPFVRTVVETLPVQSHARLAAVALEALGELAAVVKEDMAPYLDQLLPMTIENLQDQSSSHKREMALRALGQLACSTGYVIKPYFQLPTLLPKILSVLREGGSNAMPWSLRREALRTFGILGALDPYRFQIIQERARRLTASSAARPPMAGGGGGGKAQSQRDGTASSAMVGSAHPLHSHTHPDVEQFYREGGQHLGGDAAAPSTLSSEVVAIGVGLSDSTRQDDGDDEDEDDGGAHSYMYEISAMRAQPIDGSAPSGPRLTAASEDYYPTVAIKALMNILRDPSLSAHHSMVTQAVVFIFKSLGMRCVPFLNKIVPNLLYTVRVCEHGLRESIIQELAILASIVKHHLRPFLSPIFDVVCNYWDDYLEQCVALVEKVATCMREDFKQYLPRVLPLLLASLNIASPKKRLATGGGGVVALPLLPLTAKGSGGAAAGGGSSGNVAASLVAPLPNWDQKLDLVLRCLTTLRPVLLQDYLPIVVPALVKLVEQLDGDFLMHGPEAVFWQIRAIRTLTHLVRPPAAQVVAQSLASPVVHMYHRVLTRGDGTPTGLSGELREAVLDGLVTLATQLGPQYQAFAGLIDKVVVARGLGYHPKYALVRARRVAYGGWGDESGGSNGSARVLHEMDQQALQEEDVIAEYLGLNSAGEEAGDGGGTSAAEADAAASGGTAQRLHINQQNLQRAWDVSQRSTGDDWGEWIRRFSLELLRESPSPALRSCSALAQVYPPLARELFHAAFVSCWFELLEQYQDHLVRSLEVAFRSESTPPDIVQMLLNLAEFMEHDVEALPIDIRILAELAQKCHAYAKALHYKELEFQTAPAACVEALISINKKLGQPEAALGILKYAQKKLGSVIVVKESWLAKLGNWTEALGLYEERAKEEPADMEAVLGMMKCLDALGQWDDIVQLCNGAWDTLMSEDCRPNVQKKVINLAAHACWKLGQWEGMEHYLRYLDDDVVDSAFYRSILAVHNEDFEAAAINIDHARRLLDTTFTALVSESYNRAYMSMVTFQQLAEMEEIVDFRRLLLQQGGGHAQGGEDMGKPKQLLLEKWKRRLQGCRSDLSVWQRVLSVRSLILSPKDHIDAWLQFVSLCLQSKNFSLAEKILTERLAVNVGGLGGLGGSGSGGAYTTGLLVGDMNGSGLLPPPFKATRSTSIGTSSMGSGGGGAMDPLGSARFDVQYAYLKYIWAVGRKDEALQRISQLVARLQPQDVKLQVRCLLKLGDWELARLPLGSALAPPVFQKVSEAYQTATQLDAGDYKAWHSWALVNFHMMEELTIGQVPLSRKKHPSSQGNAAERASVASYNLAAAQGFLRAISLGRRRWCATVQQDLLCLLTVWFRYGNDPDLHRVLASGFNLVSLDAWLGVLPQLIARIHTRESPIRFLLDDLLSRLGSRHPQALVYPLSVALKSPKVERKVAAEALMTSLRQHYSSLVEQALLVSGELIRVAILWHEQWHEGLEESSRLYFGDGNVKAMLETLVPLHQQLEAGPTTLREAAFQQAFGRELSQAFQCIKRYQELIVHAGAQIPVTGGFVRPGSSNSNTTSSSSSSSNSLPRQHALTDADAALNQAWDLYYTVFRRINKQLPSLTSLDLQYVSPGLLGARNLELAVPGTYRVNGAAVRIAQFNPSVQVISSKQRPRKITIHGEDGRDYLFLLKGHEDLRQDERVMQLFGLVNALLARDQRTSKHDLSIQRYAVTPLSHNVGIVGWVPHCDTLHALIRDYREARKVMLGIEHRLMLQMTPDYESLPLMHKVEVFEAALDNTAGQDLYKVLWLKSENSEVWLDRRTNYTRSLAVMSMVGYILGLGDRHPSNLMLDRHTGKILHIDFGDCFEVAMHREKFPEKIPFRLTRMLTNAMEVSGIEGNFRCTCEKVMTVLRDNRDSLIAMLEAFVHDPLISWRLLGVHGNEAEGEPSGPSGVSGTAIDGAAVGEGLEARFFSPLASPPPPPFASAEEDTTSGGVAVPPRDAGEEREEEVASALSEVAGEDGGSVPSLQPRVASPAMSSLNEEPHRIVRFAEGAILSTVSENQEGGGGEADVAAPAPAELRGDRYPHQEMEEERMGVSASPSTRRARMMDIHLEIGSLAASLSANKTRFSSSMAMASHSLAHSRLDHRSTRERELMQAVGPEGMEAPAEVLNEKAIAVIRRVQDKLTGLDFDNDEALDVAEQVERLIQQATSNENLCQCFIGYCPFW